MGSQLVLLELELLRLSARGWNRQDLEQKSHGVYVNLMEGRGSRTSQSLERREVRRHSF